MKAVTNLGVICLVLGSSPALAQVPAVGGWSGNKARILVQSAPESPKYRCAFQLRATFADGLTHTWNGETSPSSGSTNSIAHESTFQKEVTNVELLKWSCSPA